MNTKKSFVVEEAAKNYVGDETTKSSMVDETAENSTNEETAENSMVEKTAENSTNEETAENSMVEKTAENSTVEETAVNFVVDETVESCMDIDEEKNDFVTVKEGRAEVSFPSSHDVLYNPAEIFSRDLNIVILKQFFLCENENLTLLRDILRDPQKEPEPKKLKVLEAVAASGLKSIRIAKETPFLKQIVANDKDKLAFSTIQRNIIDNHVQNIVLPSNQDASLLMYKNRHFKNRFDVVDLNPYGNVSLLLDAAVQCISNRGLLIVKCNDSAILCGKEVDACHAKYGAICDEISCSKEMALRILLQAIESHANRYGRYILPLLSVSQDTYMQVFVQVFTNSDEVKHSVSKISSVYVCSGCESFYLQPLSKKLITTIGPKYLPAAFPPVNAKCSICGYSYKICGPIWSDKIHDKEFLEKTLATFRRKRTLNKTATTWFLESLLNFVSMELEDAPLFYHIGNLFNNQSLQPPTLIKMRYALLNAGYKVSVTHCDKNAVKTNAPHDVIRQIAVAWIKLKIRETNSEDELVKTILAEKSSIDISFEPHPGDKWATLKSFTLPAYKKYLRKREFNRRKSQRKRKRKELMNRNNSKKIKVIDLEKEKSDILE